MLKQEQLLLVSPAVMCPGLFQPTLTTLITFNIKNFILAHFFRFSAAREELA